MLIFTELDRMRSIAQSGRWQELESAFATVAGRLAGAERAQQIASVDLGGYEQGLRADISRAYEAAGVHTAAAIYFEYDLDNRWDSAFFMCREYRPEAARDDDWACDWLTDFDGPTLEVFADLYQDDPTFGETPFSTGSTLYLIARTVSAFGRASEAVGVPPCVLCMGFHDQNPIQRLRGAA